MFPVYTYQEGMELPEEGNYYLVSGNGLWLHKDTGIVKAFIPVPHFPLSSYAARASAAGSPASSARSASR